MKTVIPTTDKDIEELLANIQHSSVSELTAMGLNAQELLKVVIERARKHYCGRVNDELVSVWGVQSETLMSREGFVWLCTTPALYKYQFVFVRHSRTFLKELEEDFDLLYGLVADDFEDSKRWLRWLGFTIDAPLVVNGKLISRFEKRIR